MPGGAEGAIGRGILAIWHDVRPERLGEVLTWYDREHHLERLGVPGFRNGRRYHAVEAEPFLFIRYETDSPTVLTSPRYLARVNAPTEWTKRSQPNFLGNIRSVCVREAWDGWAEGGFVVTGRLTALPGSSSPPRWRETATSLLELDGVVGAEFWRTDRQSSAVPTDEKRLRGRQYGHVDWAAILHVTSLEVARVGQQALLENNFAAGYRIETGIYVLAAASSHHVS